ncbi:MAG: acyltransferase [Lachnospiraceae bacterium]|nr:acyltransferase [Lachnospiraceae bacterium]
MAAKKRQANLELLRIIAMLMVITLHYLGKGNALPEMENLTPSAPDFVNGMIAWTFEILSYGAVNLYVLISGYFLINSTAKNEKVFKIVIQVLFYSIGIFLIFLVLGKLPEYASETFFKTLFFAPIASAHYWFASSYVFFYLLAPFAAVGIRKLNQKQHLGLMIICLLLFSRVWRMILPQSAPLDDKGYGLIWFLTLFTVASYIRRFVPIEKKKRPLYLVLYFLCSIITLASFFAVYAVFKSTGRFEVFIKILLEYNSPTIIISSVSLFLFFRTITIPDGFLSKTILFIAPLTFGIYLLHEHYLLRDLWITFWKVEKHFHAPYFIVHLIGCVLSVFIIGAVVEGIRKLLFGLLDKTKPVKWFFKVLGKLDVFFPKKDESFEGIE